MANNLHISYDLINPGQNYQTLISKIKELGSWAKITESFWYVDSNYSAEEACHYLAGHIDNNDKLYIVNSTDNTASMRNLPEEVVSHIKTKW